MPIIPVLVIIGLPLMTCGLMVGARNHLSGRPWRRHRSHGMDLAALRALWYVSYY